MLRRTAKTFPYSALTEVAAPFAVAAAAPDAEPAADSGARGRPLARRRRGIRADGAAAAARAPALPQDRRGDRRRPHAGRGAAPGGRQRE